MRANTQSTWGITSIINAGERKMKPIEHVEDGRDVIDILESGDPDTLDEAIERLQHIKIHFRKSYRYVVGEWSAGRRAKDTTNGQFVTKEEVIAYLEASVEQ
jgi:hypothetical protein